MMLRLLSISQHGLELGVGDDFRDGRQRVTEIQLYAQVALLYQMEADAIALVGGQVKTEEGVAVQEVAVRQSISLVLPHFAGRGEQAYVAPDQEVVVEIRLERFGGYLSPVHIHCVEADGVVLGVKRILVRCRCSTTPDVSACVPRKRFSCECDRAPAGMEYTLQSTDRIGYLTVLFSRALMCAIWTVGFRVVFFANKGALTMLIL